MARQLATPVDIVETYFDVELNRSALKKLDEVSVDEWIDFAKRYLHVMREDFAPQFFASTEADEARLRLYFEPRLENAWDSAVKTMHGPTTPLLGVNPDPQSTKRARRDEVSRMLAPLKKHLLIADSVYIRDNFYYCFDFVADSVDGTRWRQDPTTARLVERSVRRLKEWLPILIELRDLIDTRALVFMPYYLTPSFPYRGDAPALRSVLQKVRGIDLSIFDDPASALRALEEAERRPEYFNETDVLGTWLNARVLNLDPVFPNRSMFDWAANLHFEGEQGATDLTGDLISMDILPFGGADGISIDRLVKLRRNEEVFTEIRRVVVSCKAFLEGELGPGSSRIGLTAASRGFLRDHLDGYERRSVLKFVDDNPIAGIGVALAIGATLMPLAPIYGLIAGAVLTPQVARAVQRRIDPKRRAIGHLQALL